MSTRHEGRVTLTGAAKVKAEREAEIVKHHAELAVRQVFANQWIAEHDADDSWRRYQVHEHLEDGKSGDLELSHWESAQDDKARWYYIYQGGEERDPGWGRFVKLTDTSLDQGPWMSDTRAEIIEHMPFLRKLAKLEKVQSQSNVLITGLGLGMAVRAALLHGASHVDVVELNPDVVVLGGAQFQDDPRVTIHQGDAFTASFPMPPRYDLAWHDIWPTINDENLPEMARLKERYPARWTGAWQEDGCRYMDRILKMKEEYEAILGPIEENEDELEIVPDYLRPALDRILAEEAKAKADKGEG